MESVEDSLLPGGIAGCVSDLDFLGNSLDDKGIIENRDAAQDGGGTETRDGLAVGFSTRRRQWIFPTQ